jgi:hypothetical protein
VIPIPLPDILLALVGMALGAIVAVPFVWKEIRLLVKL